MNTVIMPCVMMLEHLGWDEAADMIVKALGKTIQKTEEDSNL